MDNKYYAWWKENKPFLALLPAVVFWFVSIIFFMTGLKFNNPIVFFGRDLSSTIAIMLSISNTVIQVIGNDQEQEGLGFALWIGWIGSYILGIGTNVVGLLSILQIDNAILEWSIAIGLGSMIEVLPERLVVQFLKGFKPKKHRGSEAQKPFRPMPHAVGQRPFPRESFENTQAGQIHGISNGFKKR